MKRRFFALSLAAWMAFAFAEELPDLTQFKPLPKAATGPVFTENFDSGMDGWTNPTKTFSWRKGDGMTGTGCVMAERKETNEHVYSQKVVKLEHGIYYRLSVFYRTEMVVDRELRTQELFCIRFRDPVTKKTVRGSFTSKQEVESKPDWTEWSHVFTVPEDCDTTVILELLLRVKRIGKVWFDNVTIEPVSLVGYTVFPLKNNIMTYDPAAGITYFMKLPPIRKESDYRLLVDAGGVKRLLEPKNGYAHGDFGEMSKGRVKLTATLLDMANKAVVAIDESSLFVRDVETIPGRIVMEEDGRMLRDGKPYLPVGIYLGIPNPADTKRLQRVKDAGFNSVEMVWQNVDFGGKKATQTETMLAAIREMAKYDLTFLVAIKYQLPTSRARREKMDNIVGLENVTRHVINTIKREPNIVGWYVSDENPLSDLPLIRQLRELISELDPWHPTMTLTDKPNHFQYFAKTGDYIMHDSYPVGRHVYKDSPRQSMDYSHQALEDIKKVGTPFVWVPQIFSWNSSNPSMVPRYPTAQEVRSMALLGAIYDAKAYYFYSYHHIFYYSEKTDPGHSEEQWANASVGAKLITSLAPYFLSRETAPKATVKQLSGKPVLARAFVHEGKTLVVITADGPDACEAEITVPGATGLKSRYGNTVETAPGVYRFKGLNIDSDVLSVE